MNKKKNKDVKPSQEMPKTEIQKFMDIRDTRRSIQDLAASAAEIIASEGLPTNWDDILPMLDNMEISEQSRLAAHIIFRAKQVLEEIEKSPSLNNVIFNTMVMMDILEYANIKGYFFSSPTINFNKLETQTSSLAKAIKKEKIIDTIRELAKDNPDKGITWLRKRASGLLSSKERKGFSYRQILRDTKGMSIK
tara:strand:+ start:174 stop:752 length:579 start_codon:yes stop_codon:yes gene_type:complete